MMHLVKVNAGSSYKVGRPDNTENSIPVFDALKIELGHPGVYRDHMSHLSSLFADGFARLENHIQPVLLNQLEFFMV